MNDFLTALKKQLKDIKGAEYLVGIVAVLTIGVLVYGLVSGLIF